MLRFTPLSVLVLLHCIPTARAAPEASRTTPAPAPAPAPATAPAMAKRPPPCPACARSSNRELTLRLSFAMGGFYARTTHWIRTDAALRLALGIRVHRVVVVQVALLNSVERFAPTLRTGVLWYPWRRGLYVKGAVDVVMAGAGAQPGLAAGVGFAWWFGIPIGLFAELEISGRLTEPRVLELNGVGGIFAYF